MLFQSSLFKLHHLQSLYSLLQREAVPELLLDPMSPPNRGVLERYAKPHDFRHEFVVGQAGYSVHGMVLFLPARSPLIGGGELEILQVVVDSSLTSDDQSTLRESLEKTAINIGS